MKMSHNFSNVVVGFKLSEITNSDRIVRDIFIIVLYLITTVTALFGNLLVCKVIFSQHRERKRTTTNILIGNMAISDIVGALTIPGQWLFCSKQLLDGQNPLFYEIICATIKSFQLLSFYVSTQ